MKNSRKGTKQPADTLQLWSFSQAKEAGPYLTSVVGSLREHFLDAQVHDLRAWRLGKKPGRPNRTEILEQEEANWEAKAAKERFQDALAELQSLDIYCLDPAQGLALIPFMHRKQLAWFVFDLFDGDSLRFWRFQTDPLETRRPIQEIPDETAQQLFMA